MLPADAPKPGLVSGTLPQDVRLVPLATHADDRGDFTEVFRAEWPTGVLPIQWNLVRSRAGVLRGVHLHVVHDDYLVVTQGQGLIGLHDLRPESPTLGASALVSLVAEHLEAIVIPAGVAHGFYFPVPSTHLYAVTTYWDMADELGCHWADPELQIPWPTAGPLLSPRDVDASSLAELRSEYLHRLACRQGL